jgi:hypothetical protein
MKSANSDPVHRPMHALNARRKEETADFETKGMNVIVLEWITDEKFRSNTCKQPKSPFQDEYPQQLRIDRAR